MKLVKEFGTELIEPGGWWGVCVSIWRTHRAHNLNARMRVTELLAKFERVTGHPLHPWLKRGIFFSHRKLDEILSAKERGDPIFLCVFLLLAVLYR